MATHQIHNPNDWFLRALITACIILLILYLGSSCTAYKAKICLTCATNTIIKDTVMFKETVKMDTLYKYVEGATIYKTSPCDSLGRLKPFTLIEKKHSIKTSLSSVGGVLVARCDIDSLLEVNRIITKEINRLHSVTKEVPQCFKDHKTSWSIFFEMSGKILLTLLSIYVIYRGVKFYLIKS